MRGISRTRKCHSNKVYCTDGILDSEINIFNNINSSFNLKLTTQRLSNRGSTKFAEGQSLGFKSAFKLSEKWSMAFGGENIIHFDDTTDLGRNFYMVAGTY